MAHVLATESKGLAEAKERLQTENKRLKAKVGALMSERTALQQSAKAGARTLQLLQERQKDAEMARDAEKKRADALERRVRALELGGRVLAVEAEKTIVVNSSELIEFANRHKLVIVSLDQPVAIHAAA